MTKSTLSAWLVLWALLASACVSISAAALTGKLDDDRENEIMITRTYFAWQLRKFSEIEGLASKLRDTDRRNASGYLPLSEFYQAFGRVTEVASRETAEKAWMAAYEAWIKEYPTSPTPYLAHASYLYSRGWKERGTNFYADVLPDKAATFGKDMKQCRDYLLQHAALASADPQYYVVLAECAFQSGGGHAALTSTLLAGLDRHPWYFYQYFRIGAFYMRPKWGGTQSEYDRWVELAIEKSKATDKSSMYARIYKISYGGPKGYTDILQGTRPGWKRLKLAINDLIEIFPTPTNASAYIGYACDTHDEEEVRRLYAVIVSGSDGASQPGLEPKALCDW